MDVCDHNLDFIGWLGDFLFLLLDGGLRRFLSRSKIAE
jgi:hypothetical protein